MYPSWGCPVRMASVGRRANYILRMIISAMISVSSNFLSRDCEYVYVKFWTYISIEIVKMYPQFRCPFFYKLHALYRHDSYKISRRVLTHHTSSSYQLWCRLRQWYSSVSRLKCSNQWQVITKSQDPLRRYLRDNESERDWLHEATRERPDVVDSHKLKG